MKIAAVYSIFNEEDYIEYSIKSIYNWVDKIVVMLAAAPWDAYGSEANMYYSKSDSTEKIIASLAKTHDKIFVIKGVWHSEIDQREAGMSYLRGMDIDYYFLIDGDEVYRKDHLDNIRDEIESHPAVGTFQIKCSTFWRSFNYRIPYNTMPWTPWRIFKITRYRRVFGLKIPFTCRMVGCNKANSLGPIYLIPPEKAIFYHFGYARTEERMKLKIAASPCRRKFIENWFEDVYLKWPDNREMRNLQPLDSDGLPYAMRMDTSDFPDVLKGHPYFNLDIIK